MAVWIKKQNPTLHCLQSHFSCKDTHRLKVKGWKKISYANGKQKIADLAIHISDKTDFKSRTIISNIGVNYNK